LNSDTPSETPEAYFVNVESSLAGRAAGASARAEAERLRQAAPWRSRLARVLRVQTEERRWRKGDEGERRVGTELRKLPKDRWFVFDDVPIGNRGANVDHLVIGPGGVFSLNTKNVRGKVWVAERVLLINGRRRDNLPKANREGERVSNLLSAAVGRPVFARPVLVVICDELMIKAPPLDVDVITRRALRRWLERHPQRLSPAEALVIASKAHLPGTWVTRPSSLP
jgi:hypothetical protein